MVPKRSKATRMQYFNAECDDEIGLYEDADRYFKPLRDLVVIINKIFEELDLDTSETVV